MQGEAGTQRADEVAARAQESLGCRGQETLPGGPAAGGGTQWVSASQDNVIRALKGIPTPPKFDASGDKFRMWSRSFLGFSRQHRFVEAFDLDVPIQRIRYDETCQGNVQSL